MTSSDFSKDSFGGVMYFFSRKKEGSVQTADPDLLCQFIVDASGIRLGESVAFMDDLLIVKNGARFLGVPLKHVQKVEKSLVVQGIFDMSKAYELGEKWLNEARREAPSHGKNRA